MQRLNEESLEKLIVSQMSEDGWTEGVPGTTSPPTRSISGISPHSSSRPSPTSSSRSDSQRKLPRVTSSSLGSRARSRGGGCPCAAQRHRPPRSPHRPVLPDACIWEREGCSVLCRQPISRHPAGAPQRQQHGRRRRPRGVRQRFAHLHVRAEEQHHEPNGRRRGAAVSARPRPSRAAVRVRTNDRALCTG